MKSFLRDFSLSAASAGFVAVLVGFTSSVAIVFQAASALGATPEQFSSWIINLCGVTGWFEAIMDRIPLALASALLAAVLARFAMDAFLAAQTAFGMVFAMLLAYLAGRRWWPLYAVAVVMLAGLGYAMAAGRVQTSALAWSLTEPVFTAPEFTWRALLNLALPLFVVTMASQNLPGVAAARAAGYSMPISKLITLTGVATLILAPFGAFALNLAAITAAICMGRQAHPDPQRRYVAAAVCGAIYCVIALFGAAVTGAMTAFPRELILAMAGLALLGSIGGGLAAAMQDDLHREAALLTFLVTLSGLELLGMGAAFWGIVAGALALFVQQRRPRWLPRRIP